MYIVLDLVLQLHTMLKICVLLGNKHQAEKVRWYLRVHQPAMNQADVHEIKNCYLVCELKAFDVMKPNIHIYASGQLGQDADCICNILA